jgi:GNAT superfamily N-acetyltransferase
MVRLRDLQPGDAGWIIGRHGALYAAEHGLDASFELDVADVMIGILRGFDPTQDHAVIAERHGAPVGSAFVVRAGDGVAKLRLVIVDPTARGLGVGRLLVQSCIDFARASGYTKITLWTMGMLTAARHIYATSGFVRVAAISGCSYGRDITDETWELVLSDLA